MKKRALHVFAGGKLTGSLVRSDREEDTILFGYRSESLPSDAVSVTMPVRVDQYDSMSGLLPIFEMNLPEGALKDRLRIQFAKAIPGFDDLDMLAIVGASQIGRLRYAHEEQMDATIPPQDLNEILTYDGSADLFAHLLDRFATYSGISGMQPKVLVREIRPPDRVTHRGATHIIKSFDAAEFPELAANEMICTLGAAAAGIQTAHVRLSENRKLLIVDRFDLTAAGNYLGIEDFCVLNGLRAHGRYDGSYEGIARRMSDFITPTALQRAREQYVLTVTYACAIGNGDAHLKNFSVLYKEPQAEITLAPAYDLVSTVPYIPRDSLALTMNGSKKFPNRAGLVRFIRYVTGDTEHAATQVIDQVAIGVAAATEAAKAYAVRYKDARRFAELLVARMTAGIDRLLHDTP